MPLGKSIFEIITFYCVLSSLIVTTERPKERTEADIPPRGFVNLAFWTKIYGLSGG